jgi:hypothetical protein
MSGNDERRPFVPPFQDVGLRLDDPVVRKDGDIADIHVTRVNDEEALAAGASRIELASPTEAVLPGIPRCHLMEGGMGI